MQNILQQFHFSPGRVLTNDSKTKTIKNAISFMFRVKDAWMSVRSADSQPTEDFD